MKYAAFLLIMLSFLQEQPASNKQNSEQQVGKSAGSQYLPQAFIQWRRIADSQIATTEHQEENRAQKVKEINDTLLVIFTFLLVAVGASQTIAIFRQEKWMKRNVAIARTAAEAAKKSAEVALLGERAWVTFLFPEQPIVQEFKNGQPDGWRVVGCIKNVGRTPATICNKFHFLSIVKRDENLDLIPPYLRIEESQTEYQMIPDTVEPADTRISKSDMANAEAGNLQIHVLGQVVYKDVFGISHETRYCFRYYPEETVARLRGFYSDGPAPYLKVS